MSQISTSIHNKNQPQNPHPINLNTTPNNQTNHKVEQMNNNNQLQNNKTPSTTPINPLLVKKGPKDSETLEIRRIGFDSIQIDPCEPNFKASEGKES
jgi:hypothetical protein